MPSLNLVISKIGPESDALLRNLLEHYCYDMSEVFEVDNGLIAEVPSALLPRSLNGELSDARTKKLASSLAPPL
jgi:hypothetical protein